MDKGIYFIPREFWPNYYLPPNHLHLHPDLISIERLLFPTSYFIYLKYRTITIKNKNKNILTIKLLSIKMVKLGLKKK